MPSLTANDLKTRGIAAIEESLANSTEALVSVRGKDRFVVMEVAQYHYLRECELDAALAQSRADLAAGRFVVESAQQHMERMEALLAASGAGPAPGKPALRKAAAKQAVPRKAVLRKAGRRPSAR